MTFEPFMYLSVPIPHAMERQLCKLHFTICKGYMARLLIKGEENG